MSLLALLAATAGGPTTPPPDPAGYGAEIEAFLLNHANYAAVVTVAGTGGTSIRDAIVTAAAAASSSFDKHPSDRALVIIPAGTYNQRIDRTGISKARVDIMGATLNPADVKITNPDGAEDVLEMAGAQGIVAGLHLYSDKTPTGFTSSPLHNGERATGADQFVFHKLILESAGSAGDAFSWGAGDGQSLFLSQCVVLGRMYVHNFPGTQRRTFVQLANVNVVGDVVHLLEENGKAGDTLRVLGGDVDVTYAYLPPAGAGARTWSGQIDPAAGPVPAGSPFTAGAPAYVSPIDEDAVWESYWLPDARGAALALPVIASTGSAATVANRAYYVPFTVPAAHNSGSASWSFPTPSGTLQLALLADANGAPGGTLWNVESVAVAGTVTRTGFSRVLVPGETYWLAYSVNTGAAVGATGPAPVGTRYKDLGSGGVLTGSPTGTTAAAGNILAASMTPA